MEFTLIAKEVKIIAQFRGIRLHQYLDDWLIRSTTYQDCLQQTNTLVGLCQELGRMVNLGKSELEPQQVFNFVGYQYDLVEGRVRPTQERWDTLRHKVLTLLTSPTC